MKKDYIPSEMDTGYILNIIKSKPSPTKLSKKLKLYR